MENIGTHCLAKFQNLGKCIFMDWRAVDSLFNAWAKAYFGEHACGVGVRDEDSCYVGLHDLKHEDFQKFKDLFDTYDKDGDYDAEEEFVVGVRQAELPSVVTNAIVSILLSKNSDIQMVKTEIAIHDGVFFMENELDWSTCI